MFFTSLALFFLDFLSLGLFDGRYLYLLLIYLIFCLIGHNNIRPVWKWYVIALFMIEETMFTGRFGMSLIYLIPMYFLGPIVNDFFRPNSAFPPLILYAIFLVFNVFFIRWMLLGNSMLTESTFYVICINIVLLLLVSKRKAIGLKF